MSRTCCSCKLHWYKLYWQIVAMFYWSNRTTDWLKSGWPLSSHHQIPWLFQTFQVNIYGVSTLATVEIQNEIHVISHCNTLLKNTVVIVVTVYCRLQWNNSLFLPSLRSRPLKLNYGGWGSAVSSPTRVWGGAQQKSNLVHFSLKNWHLVATISKIFLRTNWPNFVHARTHFPWLFYFPWPLLNSLTFPGFSGEWRPCEIWQ